jgi:hypothetical protein
MSIHELFQPNTYDIYANTITITNPISNSFRKGKTNIQPITPLDVSPLVGFDTFMGGMPFLYDNSNNYFTFIDDFNIRIDVTGVYEVFGQINTGNETPGSFIGVGFQLQGTIILQSIPIAIEDSLYLPINNGLHSQNTGAIISGIAFLNQNDIIQMQYFVSANSDIYPSSYIGMKYVSS